MGETAMGEAWRKVVDSGAVAGPIARCSGPPPEELLAGIRLFNRGEYYECHHELEDIWLTEPDPIRYLYQGILQIGVGFHHLGNQNFRGATILLGNGIDKLAYYQPSCMMINTGRLHDEAQACLSHLLDLGNERIGEFDWSLVPRIELVDQASN